MTDPPQLAQTEAIHSPREITELSSVDNPSLLISRGELENHGISHVADGLICRAEQMPGPVDAFVFCGLAANELTIEIDVAAFPQIPSGLPALVLRLQDRTFRILYRPSCSSLSVQISILHELAHILLGHCQHTPAHRLLRPCLYTNSQQREAELLAQQMMAVIVQKSPNETDPIAARFERLMSKKPKTLKRRTPEDHRSTSRFRALMAPERRKRHRAG
ncbi:hypothetical protein HYR99_03605 [Candidatus Poribacteria bacterium]|nr:hypothetical protein [Candidatus Poribacteria bacterium]